MTNKEPVEIDSATGKTITLPPTEKPKRYRTPLDTVGNVRKEMAKIYRESRSGLLDTQDLTKLTYCLNIISKTIESSDLEQRIKKLEIEEQNKKYKHKDFNEFYEDLKEDLSPDDLRQEIIKRGLPVLDLED